MTIQEAIDTELQKIGESYHDSSIPWTQTEKDIMCRQIVFLKWLYDQVDNQDIGEFKYQTTKVTVG